MKNSLNASLWLVLIAQAALCGCTNHRFANYPDQVPVSPEARTHSGTTRIVVGVLPESSVPVVAGGSSSGQYGLIGVITQTVIERNVHASAQDRQRALLPIEEAAIDFNFGRQIRTELERALKPIAWLGVQSVSRESAFQEDEAQSLLRSAPEDRLLVVDASYEMESNFSAMLVRGNAVLISKRGAKPPEPGQTEPVVYPVVYRNLLSYRYPFEGKYVTADQAAVDWAKDKGAMIHRALQTGVADIAKSMSKQLR